MDAYTIYSGDKVKGPILGRCTVEMTNQLAVRILVVDWAEKLRIDERRVSIFNCVSRSTVGSRVLCVGVKDG